ncbi:MAG: hypothetical protein AAGA54_23240, partial [Myxococcota bacterium]
MKRFGLMFVTLSLFTACDPADESLDDTGASGSDTAETEGGSDSESDTASASGSGGSASDSASG